VKLLLLLLVLGLVVVQIAADVVSGKHVRHLGC